jgi:ketosteroid isomerase-like protein
MSKAFWTVLLAAGFALVSTALNAQAGAPDLESAKRAIRIADLELAKAVADRSLQSFLALLDNQAVFIGKEVSRGRDAVAKAWLPFFQDRSLFLKWYPTQVEVSASADLGYSIGEFERIGKDSSGNPTVATGNYVSIWRKQPDGRWKVVLDIGTPATPVPGKP